MLFVLLAALAAPVTPPGAAAPVAQATAVDAATLAEAVRLLDAQGFDEDALRSSELGLEAAMAAMTEQLHKSFGDALPAEFVAQMRQVMRDHMRTTMLARMPALKRDAAELYAREFTRAELVRLRLLAADPVMVKARERNRILAPRLDDAGDQRDPRRAARARGQAQTAGGRLYRREEGQAEQLIYLAFSLG